MTVPSSFFATGNPEKPCDVTLGSHSLAKLSQREASVAALSW